MFALHQPRPRWVASQDSTHEVNSGSPKSPGMSCVRPVASGQVIAIVRARIDKERKGRRARKARCFFAGFARLAFHDSPVADYSDWMSLRLFGLSARRRRRRCPPRRRAQAPARSIGGVARHARSRPRVSRDGDLARRPPRRLGRGRVGRRRRRRAIYLRAMRRPPPRRHSVTASNDGRGHREDGIAWSPDGHTLAFLSDDGSPRPAATLCDRRRRPRAPARRVTSVEGQLAQPRWSPDGKQLAVLFVAGSTQGTGALVAYKPDAGVVGDVVEEQRIAIVDLATGRCVRSARRTCSCTTTTGRPTGRRSSRKPSKDRARTTTGSRSSTSSRADSGKTTSIWKPPLQIAGPRWSPDGKSIAVIHGIMSDEGQTGGDIYVVPCGRRRGEERHAESRGIGARAGVASRRPHPLSGVRRRPVGARDGRRDRRHAGRRCGPRRSR